MFIINEETTGTIKTFKLERSLIKLSLNLLVNCRVHLVVNRPFSSNDHYYADDNDDEDYYHSFDPMEETHSESGPELKGSHHKDEEYPMVDEEVDYTEGKTMKLKCWVEEEIDDANVAVSVLWYLNGSLINGGKNRRLKIIEKKSCQQINIRMENSNLHRLRIKNVRLSDTGDYACLWKLENGTSGWYNYTVMVFPRSDDYPEPQALTAYPEGEGSVTHELVMRPAGNVIDLKCNKGESKDVVYDSVTWLKNGEEPKRELGEVKIRGMILKMRNIIPSDSGNYTCYAKKGDQYINKTFSVHVIVTVGNSTVFQCILTRDQVPYITWLKHNKKHNGTIDVDDKGSYTVLKSELWAILYLTVGRNVSLSIAIYEKNTPVPYIVWCKDLPHSIVDSEPFIDKMYYEAQDCKDGKNLTLDNPQILTLNNITKEDEGWYTCVAANSLGISYSTAYLEVVDAIPLRAKDDNLSSIYIVVGVLGLTVILLVGLLSTLYQKYKKKPKADALRKKEPLPICTKKKLEMMRHINSNLSSFSASDREFGNLNSQCHYIVLSLKVSLIKNWLHYFYQDKNQSHKFRRFTRTSSISDCED
ncbi:Fibroblast growth factor receptor 3 [Armadillidium nasatum]|uniref:Fibroblast growth factor receptor 3 n=1 Tax=Armadillidium nasatum TaxID=96803 RepID=A0A5N5TIE8_9CRUS|nr:Fibroblast growth factor receptor 3 [Armadillidium nasatum]